MAQKSLPMSTPVLLLYELQEGQEADFFALLSEKQEMKTRDGKPYHNVGSDFKLAVGDLLILLGGHKALDDAARILSPAADPATPDIFQNPR